MRSRNQPCIHASSVDRTLRISCYVHQLSRASRSSLRRRRARGSTSALRLTGALGDDAPALSDPHLASFTRE